MPLIDIDEPHAKPPRRLTVRANRQWSGVLDVDRGLAELDGFEIGNAELDLTGCEELSISESAMTAVVIGAGGGPTVEIRASRLDGCDLSQVRVTSIHRSHLDGCKLTGTDLSGASLTDVAFERCSFRYTNLRMAKLNRVSFIDCILDEVDGYQMEAADVSVDRSRSRR